VLSSEINGSGPITGIAFRMRELDPADNTPGGDYTVNVRMAHTTLSELTNTFADNYDLGAPVDIANNLSFTIPAGIPAGGYVWVPLTGTFSYNGIDNLIVEVEVLSASAGNMTWAPNAGANKHLYGAVGDVTGTLSLYSHDIKLRFNGGTVDAGLPANADLPMVFDNTADGAVIQSLYRPVDLGTGGQIQSIGVRLVNDSVAAVHSNYTIRMGHTAKTVLNPTDTFASNMDEDMTVYSGSFSVPAGLKAGDWVTIPLGTGFNYDPARNLVILFSTLGGAISGNDVHVKGGLRYPSSIVGSYVGSDTVPLPGPENGVVVTRLYVQK